MTKSITKLSTPSPFKKNSSSTPASTKKSKLKQLDSYSSGSPFANFSRPTQEESQNVHDLLSTVHGRPERPAVLVDRVGDGAGCGEVPSVLDALVRTILSQNTTSSNSRNAKNAMNSEYGRGNYFAVLAKPLDTLVETIRVGGLAKVKGTSIYGILNALKDKNSFITVRGVNGSEDKEELSLDYLHDFDDRTCMKELVSFPGVGPKTASCVLLFCLGRPSFAVDTHVFRISKSLGWLPSNATRNTAFAHLDALIPSELKYGLHSLIVKHGRGCKLCSANGNRTMDFVESCPIDGIVTRSKDSEEGEGKKKKGKGKSMAKEKKAVKGKGKKRASLSENEDSESEAVESEESEGSEESEEEMELSASEEDEEDEKAFKAKVQVKAKASPRSRSKVVVKVEKIKQEAVKMEVNKEEAEDSTVGIQTLVDLENIPVSSPNKRVMRTRVKRELNTSSSSNSTSSSPASKRFRRGIMNEVESADEGAGEDGEDGMHEMHGL